MEKGLSEKIIQENLKIHKYESNVYKAIHPEVYNWYQQGSIKRDVKKIFELNTCKSILDVGCGYGAFKLFLDKQGLELNYAGIDIVEDMVKAARATQPEVEFQHGDILDCSFSKHFDYVICNGIFTQKLKHSDADMEAYTKIVIKKMYDLAKVGIGFNLLTDFVDFKNPDNFYFGPGELLEWLGNVSCRFELIHSYPLFEYTTFVYKS